jgi:hypothetical protein
MHRLKRLHIRLLPHYGLLLEGLTPLLCALVFMVPQVYAVTRFNDRSLFIQSPRPGVTTAYTITLSYNTLTSVGSMDLLFCVDPIPEDPCHAPAGLDVSHAQLTSQSGVVGYSLKSESSNHIVLTRTPGVVSGEESSYVLSGIVNPTVTGHSFAIRMSDYASTDASGSLIDLGSVVTQVNNSVVLQTQVPPMLIFCVAQRVNLDCSGDDGIYFSDLGNIDATHTLTTTSQMAAGTNASSGYVITANGPSMEAGTNVINSLSKPTASTPGVNQFGINLAVNTTPEIGASPDGDFMNATATPEYNQPNHFAYQDGAVVASAPNVSLIRRFTVSYIVNAASNLRAGVYTTTLTYICSGRF